MRCEEVMELIQRNLDDDLSSSESANMHEHLLFCQECQSLHESLSKLSFELENLPDIEPPVSIVDSILPQLEMNDRASAISMAGMHQPKTQRGPLLWKRWALVAGSAAAVLLIWISAENLRPTESDSSKEQMQSAANHAPHSASVIDPKLEESASPEVAMKHSLGVTSEQEAANKALSAAERKQPAQPKVKEKQASPSPVKGSKEKQEEHAVALDSLPKYQNRKAEAEAPKPEAMKQQPADQQMALAPQEKATAPEEQMPSIAAVQPSAEEVTTPPPMALAPKESTDMFHALMAPELSDAREAASRGQAVYPSPDGEWVAQVEGQNVAIIDQNGMEVFRSHSWPSEMQVNVEWLDNYLLQYTLTPPRKEENRSTSAEVETWRINIQDRQEQKQ